MLPEIDDYYWTMAARNRLLQLHLDGDSTALCTFFLLPSLNLLDRYRRRSMWSTPPDLATGSIVYIDKLVARCWNRGLFRAVETAVTQVAPQWTTAVWYRPSPGQAPDRRYTYRRRTHGSEHRN